MTTVCFKKVKYISVASPRSAENQGKTAVMPSALICIENNFRKKSRKYIYLNTVKTPCCLRYSRPYFPSDNDVPNNKINKSISKFSKKNKWNFVTKIVLTKVI